MLKTTGSLDLASRELETDEIVGGGGKADDRNPSKKLKNAKFEIQTYIRAMGEPIFLTPNTKEIFNQLRQVFTKALILQYFDLKCYIRIETNVSGYTLGEVLS